MTSSHLRRTVARISEDPRVLLGAMVLIGLAAVAAGLVTQHVFGMRPCPWCILQRVIFLACSLVCVIGLLWRRPAGLLLTGGLGLLLALSGCAAALWQHFYASRSDSCAVTLAERIVAALGLDTLLPSVFFADAGCADATPTLFAVPFPLWSLMLFLIMGLGFILVMHRARR